MTLRYQFRPIDRWPYENTKKRRSKLTFSASFTETLKLLEDELFRLKANTVVLQVDVRSADIRNDGMLRANVQPMHPGVILSFNSKSGPLSFPCDSCMNWTHNVRSIALALQALRAVDRYGVTKRAEQYKGWAALPSPEGDGAIWKVPESYAEARSFVTKIFEVSISISDGKLWELAKQGQRKYHPDTPNADPRMSRAFNAAVQILEKA